MDYANLSVIGIPITDRFSDKTSIFAQKQNMKVADFTGETLKELRKKHRFTQRELGGMLGIEYSSISAWESGKRLISIPYRHLFILFFEKLEKKQ